MSDRSASNKLSQFLLCGKDIFIFWKTEHGGITYWKCSKETTQLGHKLSYKPTQIVASLKFPVWYLFILTMAPPRCSGLPSSPLLFKLPLALNFSRLHCKWGQSLWEEIRSCFIVVLLPLSKISEPDPRAGSGDSSKLLFEWHPSSPCSRSWCLVALSGQPGVPLAARSHYSLRAKAKVIRGSVLSAYHI